MKHKQIVALVSAAKHQKKTHRQQQKKTHRQQQ